MPRRAAAIAWRLATVVDVWMETPRTRTLVLDVPGWPGHGAGQHVDVRLTSEHGYQAQRSYSIASAPHDARVALTVDRLDDGDVSPYLTDVLRKGDRLELRGPIGGYFVWDVAVGGPLLLVAGGSGIVPLMAMLRHRAAVLETPDARRDVPARLLYASRRWDDMIYRDALARLADDDATLDVALTFTREPPPGLDRISTQDRPHDAGGGRLAAARTAAHFRLRPHPTGGKRQRLRSSSSATIRHW